MTQIFVAKTVEDAKLLAARSFNAPVTDIQFEVLEEPKKSLFGFKKGEARVRATYVSIDVSDRDYSKRPVVAAQAASAAPAEEPAPVQEEPAVQEPVVQEPAAQESAVQEPAVQEQEDEVVVSAEPVTAEEVFDSEPAPAVIETVAVEVETAQEVAETAPQQDAGVPEDADLISGEPSEAALQKIEKAKEYLTGVLAAMEVEAELRVTAGAESAMIDIEATSNGAVIGKRGETLDALQYLTFMIANRGDKEYYRIILNSAGYRERRRKTLEELAAKIARNVQRSGRQTTLEPMNPYERRIIHSTIAGIEGVTSRSVGEEPYRKVVISSTERQGGRRRRGDRNDRSGERRNDRRRNDRRRNNDAPPTRINMDSMKTSFEKDYKRPKPEDDLNAGLYGKIEF